MVITRSQALKNNRNDRTEMEDLSDNESNVSFSPDLGSRDHNFEINDDH